MKDYFNLFKNLAKRNQNLKDKDNRFFNIQFASVYVAGIELRNLQRQNNNLDGDFEIIPYTKKELSLIDEYTEKVDWRC